MRRLATIATFAIVMLFCAATATAPVSAVVNCCQYAFIFGDTEAHPGEVVQITGFIGDQYGAAEAGVQIQYVDPSSNLNTTTGSAGVFRLSFTIPEFPNSSTAYYSLTMTDSGINWSVTVTGSYSMNTAPSSSSAPTLYYSQGLGGRGSYVDLISPTLPAIIYVGGGYELDSLHGVGQLDDATTNFLNYLVASGFNVIAPVSWYVSDYASFPLTIGALLKYGFLINRVYLIGWSAGGVASAWALTHDFQRTLNLAVIMDAELTGPTEAGTHTDYSVFTTAQSASQVSIPHVLVWGEDDSGTISIQTAGQWFRNAQPGLVRVDPLPYSHTWLGTSAEPVVRQDITSFFKAGNVGSFEMVPSNSPQAPVTMQVTTNNPIGAVDYNSSAKVLQISVSNQANAIGVLNLVIPKILLNGEPVVTSGKQNLAPSTFSDANNYYVFYSYTDNIGEIKVGGQNSLPEFSSVPFLFITIMLFMLVISVITGKNSEKKKPKIS